MPQQLRVKSVTSGQLCLLLAKALASLGDWRDAYYGNAFLIDDNCYLAPGQLFNPLSPTSPFVISLIEEFKISNMKWSDPLPGKIPGQWIILNSDYSASICYGNTFNECIIRYVIITLLGEFVDVE